MRRTAMLAATGVLLALTAGCGGGGTTPAAPASATPTMQAVGTSVPAWGSDLSAYGLNMSQQAVVNLVEVFRSRYANLSAGRDDNAVFLSFLNTCSALRYVDPAKPETSPTNVALTAFLSYQADVLYPSVTQANSLASLARERMCANYTR